MEPGCRPRPAWRPRAPARRSPLQRRFACPSSLPPRRIASIAPGRAPLPRPLSGTDRPDCGTRMSESMDDERPPDPQPIDPERAQQPGRLLRLWLAMERMGPRANLVLFLLTVLSTTLIGGLFLLVPGQTAPGILWAGLKYGLCAMAILGTHELGHTLACRYYRVSATLPYFLPMPLAATGTLGAVIRIRERLPNRNALFDMGIAGPVAGFLVLLPVLAWGLHVAEPVPQLASADGSGYATFSDPPLVQLLLPLVRDDDGSAPADLELNPFLFAAWFGMLATAMNLIPAGQLDGGHVAYALSTRFHSLTSRASLAGLAAAATYGFVQYGAPFWIVWMIVVAWMGPRHPAVTDEGAPLSVGRRWFALVAGLIFLLCFTPVPFHY